VAAREDVRRRQAPLRQRRAVRPAANRRQLRLEPHAADGLLEVREDVRIVRERVSHVAVLDLRLDLDRAPRVRGRDLRGDPLQQLDVLLEQVVLEVADDEAEVDHRAVARDQDGVDVSLPLVRRLR
jgi:hypothetical protein